MEKLSSVSEEKKRGKNFPFRPGRAQFTIFPSLQQAQLHEIRQKEVSGEVGIVKTGLGGKLMDKEEKAGSRFTWG